MIIINRFCRALCMKTKEQETPYSPFANNSDMPTIMPSIPSLLNLSDFLDIKGLAHLKSADKENSEKIQYPFIPCLHHVQQTINDKKCYIYADSVSSFEANNIINAIITVITDGNEVNFVSLTIMDISDKLAITQAINLVDLLNERNIPHNIKLRERIDPHALRFRGPFTAVRTTENI